MQTVKLLLSSAILWVCMVLVPAHARALEGSPPKVQLSLFNDAAVPPDVLATSQTRATNILMRAGIQVEWKICRPRHRDDFTPSTPDCSNFAWPQHLSVRIVRRGTTISDDVFGMSFLDESGEGVYATIFYENLSLSKDHPELNDAEMLGFAIVHEVGHLLLGLRSHSPFGVMQGRWGKATLVAASRGDLFLSESEANRMRTTLEKGAFPARIARQQMIQIQQQENLFGRRKGFSSAFLEQMDFVSRQSFKSFQ